MNRPRVPSIRGRLASVILVMSLVWGGLVALVLAVVLHEGVGKLLDGGLQESAEILYGVLSTQGPLPHAQEGMLPAPPHEEGLIWQRWSADGRLVQRSHQAPTTALSLRRTTGFSDAERDARVYTLPLGEGRGLLHVAQRAPARLQAHALILGTSVTLALVLGFVSAWWLNLRARAELRPLHALSEAVTTYDPLHGDHRLPPGNRAELVPVVQAIEGLGERLAQRVANEQAFAAHAAHALRTPLAGLDAQLAVALREVPSAVQPRLLRMREATARLSRVVHALIHLFRAGGELHWQRVALTEELARIPVKGLVLQAQALEALTCDPDLLVAAVLNLLDNAVRHGATQVHIQGREGPGGPCELTLHDNGEGLSPAHLESLQQALDGQRYTDTSGASGAACEGRSSLGLGLTLTDLVARAHGGCVRLQAGPLGGLQVTMRWVAPATMTP